MPSPSGLHESLHCIGSTELYMRDDTPMHTCGRKHSTQPHQLRRCPLARTMNTDEGYNMNEWCACCDECFDNCDYAAYK